MTLEDIIGESAEVINGPLLGQQGIVVGLTNNRIILKTTMGRLRIALTDVELLGCVYQTPQNKQLNYDPYKDKT